MLPAPKGGSRSPVRMSITSVDGLQCCPPRRAGVGRRWPGSSPRGTCFNAARPEGRESALHAAWTAYKTAHASMLPAPKGGSRGTSPGNPNSGSCRFNAARPEGRESAAAPARHPRPDRHASMLPAPKGGSRLSMLSVTSTVVVCFNAARPEGRESASSSSWGPVSPPCFNAARPEGRESGRSMRSTGGWPNCFNAARPEGRESAAGSSGHDVGWPPLQCCPPRRAGVGMPDGPNALCAAPASMLPAPKGGSRPPGRV